MVEPSPSLPHTSHGRTSFPRNSFALLNKCFEANKSIYTIDTVHIIRKEPVCKLNMPRGKNYTNNNKGVAMKAHKKKSDQMTQCFYGDSCTRKDCVYRHDKTASQGQKKSNEPCMAFLAGTCVFSASKCSKRHPPKDECDRLISKYQITPCRFGEDCKTNGCLFLHPSDNAFPPLPTASSASGNTLSTTPLSSSTTSSLGVLPVPSAWRPAPPPPSHRGNSPQGLSAHAREFVPAGMNFS